MRSKISSAGSAAALALLVTACAGCSQPQVHARVVGLVVEAATERPLTGVAVTSHGMTATTDSDGRYELDVTVGVRELTFVLLDGRQLRKFVIPRDASDVRLDVLVPAVGASRTPELLLQRRYPSDKDSNDLSFDAGNQFLLSATDAFGNDDHFFTPPWNNYQRPDSPVWSPTGDAIYFSDRTGVNHGDELPLRGLQRFEPATGTLTHMWFKAHQTDCIAVAPDGQALVASNGNAYLFREPLVRSNKVSDIYAPTSQEGASVSFVAWGPSANLYVGLWDTGGLPNGRVHHHIERFSTDLTSHETFLDDADRPLPLADGALIYWHGGDRIFDPGLRLREVDGTTRDLMPGDWIFPIAFDRAANAVTYLLEQQLHRRNLTTGLDLVIVQSVDTGSVKP
jgi:hypothetical protein